MSPKTPPLFATLVDRRDVTAELVVMKFKPSAPFPFKAGQSCTIGIDNVYRPYSIVSSPEEKDLELFIRLVQGGELTPKIWQLQRGDDIVLLPKATGAFTFEQGPTTQVMVATSTGLAPFMSFLRSELNYPQLHHQSKKDFFLFLGASFQTEFYAYANEVKTMAPDLTYVPTVSRPEKVQNDGWKGKEGRVNSICEDLLSEHSITPQSTIIYLCGNPGMITDLEPRLITLGFTVKTEKYWA